MRWWPVYCLPRCSIFLGLEHPALFRQDSRLAQARCGYLLCTLSHAPRRPGPTDPSPLHAERRCRGAVVVAEGVLLRFFGWCLRRSRYLLTARDGWIHVVAEGG